MKKRVKKMSQMIHEREESSTLPSLHVMSPIFKSMKQEKRQSQREKARKKRKLEPSTFILKILKMQMTVKVKIL